MIGINLWSFCFREPVDAVNRYEPASALTQELRFRPCHCRQAGSGGSGRYPEAGLFRRNEPKVGWYRVDSPLSTSNVMSVGVFEYKESTVRIKQKKKQNKKLGIRRGKKWETG